MKNILLIAFIAVVTLSCKKDETNPTTTSIFGTWELMQQSGTIAGTNKTFNKGEGNQLKFTTDSTYQMFTKSQLSSSGRFSIVKKGVNWAGANYDAIYLNGNIYPGNYNYVILPNFMILNGNSLVIGDTFADGVKSVYIKQ